MNDLVLVMAIEGSGESIVPGFASDFDRRFNAGLRDGNDLCLLPRRYHVHLK